MADSKITALTSISTSTDPANDPLVIVDVSDTSMAATGTTKKVTLNQLLGASGTATLASATISGDLTVDTSTLKVDSALNRVGVGTASPAFTLDVQATVAGAVYGSVANNDTGGSGSARFRVFNSGDVSDGFAIINNYGAAGQVNLLNYKASSLALWTNSVERFTISSTGVATWSNVGGVAGTAMTLNSTGLGVGASPGYKLHVGGYSSANIAPDAALVRSSSGTTIQSGPNLLFSDGTSVNNVVLQNTQGRFGIWNYGAGVWNERLSVDSSGNVGIGVTSPSYQLHVSKSQSSATTLFVDNQQNNAAASSDLWLSAYGGNWNLSVPHSATFVNPLIFKFGSTERMRITSDGNVGIGVASPAFKLDVAGSAGSGIRFTGNSVQNVIGETGGNGLVGTVSNHNLGFYTNATLRALIDTSGQVGIGVQPSAWASGYKVIQGQIGGFALSNDNSSNNQLRLSSNAYFDTTDNRWEYYGSSTATAYEQRAGEHRFFNAPSGTLNTAITFTQAMTLDASGNLLVGTTGLNGSWNTKLTLSNDSGTTKWAVGPYLGGVTNFLISAGASAGVYLNGTAATSWTSASDERLKDIIEPISNAIAKVGSLRAVIGKFKFDENNTRKPFLIAQDIQAVLPEAVDASNPEKLGVAYTDVIPLLVAAIKELTARVQTLETR